MPAWDKNFLNGLLPLINCSLSLSGNYEAVIIVSGNIFDTIGRNVHSSVDQPRGLPSDTKSVCFRNHYIMIHWE